MISNSSASVNPLPSQMIEEIVKSVTAAAQKSSGPNYVSLDADGTLWLEDAGELFFSELIESKLVDLPKDPVAYYQSLKAKHPPTAYTWLAQILKGRSLSEVKGWARNCYENRRLSVFEDIRALVKKFRQQSIEVWVVTASVQWPVEVAVQLHGFPVTGVLGVTTKVDHQGLVTEEGLQPVTWREGKAEAMKAKRPQSKPLFCAGNTTGDLALLELSATKPLALHSHQLEGALKDSELELQKIAKERGWLAHQF